MLTATEILFRVLIAAVCSGLVGLERETARKEAGLRTHTLLGVGAAIFTIASVSSFDGPDEARIAAQVVSGVGFLGAGAIFRDRGAVSGLTTAAGIWVVAALGMAAGAGSFALATIGTVVSLAVLWGLRAVDASVARRTETARRHLRIVVDQPAKLESLLTFVERVDPDAVQEDFHRDNEGNGVLLVSCLPDNVAMLSDLVASHKIVTEVEQLRITHTPPGRRPGPGPRPGPGTP
ncbi:MgtC/SapB family protein [Salsipaludibacter albus]|uniref:MgtC/SapB family protein n=1 Tax=Salsipaludibacter albus TaxID=2849650 RepID=UPI001EE3FC29|nr:MgtC/SapB family protein [Salsipaludibacter albus]MBY5161586.1 MgtC/SapB family protein [Salsipaludibacter albus]